MAEKIKKLKVEIKKPESDESGESKVTEATKVTEETEGVEETKGTKESPKQVEERKLSSPPFANAREFEVPEGSKKFLKVAKLSVYALVFLLPVFFLPFTRFL